VAKITSGQRSPAGRARHLHVEEHEVRRQARDLGERFHPVGGLADHLQAGVRLQELAKARARRRLVVDDQGPHHAGSVSTTEAPLPPGPSPMVMAAASP
jgi:hypothetical protein